MTFTLEVLFEKTFDFKKRKKIGQKT
jgi:hypothetical protein